MHGTSGFFLLRVGETRHCHRGERLTVENSVTPAGARILTLEREERREQSEPPSVGPGSSSRDFRNAVAVIGCRGAGTVSANDGKCGAKLRAAPHGSVVWCEGRFQPRALMSPCGRQRGPTALGSTIRGRFRRRAGGTARLVDCAGRRRRAALHR